MIENLSKFDYPLHWNHKRNPARPMELQVLDFDDWYDYKTIWNDAVQINQNTVLLIGPPLYDTKEFLQTNCSILEPNSNKCICKTTEMDRVCVVSVSVSDWVEYLILKEELTFHKIPVNKTTNEFTDKKVIVTMSKNQPITWLQQWIDYYKTVHNVDGLLLYNNRSSIYSTLELANALHRDDMIIKIFDYDVPYGAAGGGDWEDKGRSGTYLPWDSDFAQYVMLEHSKWRYLHCAKLVINADTDELLTINNGNTLDDVADYCQDGEHSVLLYDGIWIEPVHSITGIIARTVPFEERHFSDYYHTCYSKGRGIGVKWVLNPKKNLQYQWHLHKTFGPNFKTTEIGFGHYFSMNISWNYIRDEFYGDGSKLVVAEDIKTNIDLWKSNTKHPEIFL